MLEKQNKNIFYWTFDIHAFEIVVYIVIQDIKVMTKTLKRNYQHCE